MAEPSAPLTAADRIRSLSGDDAVFGAFDSYPWKKDKTFMVRPRKTDSIQATHPSHRQSYLKRLTCNEIQSGLHAILGDPSDPQGSLGDMATHARIFYYAQKIGVTIDFSRYKAWLSQHPDHQLPEVLPDEYLARDRAASPQSHPSSSVPSLPWQQAAPKADLYVDKKAAAAAASQSGANEPSYPMRFAEMIKLLQEGKEVPGIRQIPNTTLRDPVRITIGLPPSLITPAYSITVSKTSWVEGSSQKAMGKGQCLPCRTR
jgi:hypothetical protein